MLLPKDLVVLNSEIELEDKNLVGSEIACLGEFAKNKGEIPKSIILTPHSYNAFLDENNLQMQIKHLLGSINHENHDSTGQISSHLRKVITGAKLPTQVVDSLFLLLESKSTYKIEAYYFQGSTMLGTYESSQLTGGSVILDNVRDAWAGLFSTKNLRSHYISHHNHHEFFATVAILPLAHSQLSGHIKTLVGKKGEYEIEAHSHVRFVYSKHADTIKGGFVLSGGEKDALKAQDLQKLLTFAKIAEKVFYHPHLLNWEKIDDSFIVTKIVPISSVLESNGAYKFLSKSMTVTPGITIGRLKLINEKNREETISSEEIVLLRDVDRRIISTLKKAKGIIVEGDPHPEIIELLKGVGIPTVVRKHERLLYSTGDVISLNATTGEVRRGSMMIS